MGLLGLAARKHGEGGGGLKGVWGLGFIGFGVYRVWGLGFRVCKV